MKKATTILKQINELENELYENYTYKEINKAFDILDKKGYKYSVTSLLYVIATGVENDIKLEEEFGEE